MSSKETQMPKNFNLNFTVYKDDYLDIIKKSQDLKIKVMDNIQKLDWEPGDFCEEAQITFRGPKNSLVELAAFDHELHGGGFSFSEEEVLDCLE